MLSVILVLLHLGGCLSQWRIGFMDPSLLNYVQGQLNRNQTRFVFANVTFVTTVNTNTDDFIQRQSEFATQRFNAIIGKFDYEIATLCVQLSTPFFVIDEQLIRTPTTRPLIDFSLNIELLGGALNFVLSKYNWTQNLKFISDSSANSLEILMSLAGQSVQQCNFDSAVTSSLIEDCYRNQNFLNSPGASYVMVTDDSQTNILNLILGQSVFRSLPFQSFLFLPMLNTSENMIKYFYAGGVLYSIKQTRNESETSYSLVNTHAHQALLYLNQTINSNNLTVLNQSLLVAFATSPSSAYTTTGAKKIDYFYWNHLTNATTHTPQLVSLIQSNPSFGLPTSIASPLNIAAVDVISVVYVSDPVFIKSIPNSDGTITQEGFVPESLNVLLTPMNLSYITVAANGTNIIGRFNSTQSSGIMAAMLNNVSVMTAFPVPIVNSYLNRFIFSEKAYDVVASVLIRKAVKSIDLLRLVKPYSIMVWLLIMATVVYVSIILWLINLISPSIAASSDKLTLSNSIFMVIGSLFIAKMLVKPTMVSTQLLYLIIWLGSILLIASYVANLSVSISFETNQLIDFSTLDDLYDRTTFEWVFLKDSIVYNRIMNDIEYNNTDSIYVKLYTYGLKTWGNRTILDSTTNIPDFLMQNSHIGLINDDFHNLYYSLSNCSLVTLRDVTHVEPMAYIMQPDFKYVNQLSQQIIQMKTVGIMDTLVNKYFMLGKCPTSIVVTPDVGSLTINEMAGIFLLIGIGIILAFPAALIEILAKKSKLQCQRSVTKNSLKFGQIYKAKVISLDRNGVTVDIGRLSLFSTSKEGRIYYVHKKYLGVKKKGEREILAPTDQGIMIGTKLLLKYLGNNPVDSKRIFVQIQKK